MFLKKVLKNYFAKHLYAFFVPGNENCVNQYVYHFIWLLGSSEQNLILSLSLIF